MRQTERPDLSRIHQGTSASSVRIYSYVIEHDLGFAPNPFHGVCTLAACKPRIRETAQEGDYVIGTGSAKPELRSHLCYWMRVSEIITFDEYWNDLRFLRKRPVMRGSLLQRYGDNIYHIDPSTKNYVQDDSFHSYPNGVLCKKNLERDTGRTDRVLVSFDFTYWGRLGPKFPEDLKDFVMPGVGHKCRFTDEEQQRLLTWVLGLPERGYIGEPAQWQFL